MNGNGGEGASGVAMMVGGPALYLLGESLVRLRMVGSLSSRRLVTVVALGMFGVLGRDLPALALSAGVATTLGGLTVWDRERIRPTLGPFARFRAGGNHNWAR